MIDEALLSGIEGLWMGICRRVHASGARIGVASMLRQAHGEAVLLSRCSWSWGLVQSPSPPLSKYQRIGDREHSQILADTPDIAEGFVIYV